MPKEDCCCSSKFNRALFFNDGKRHIDYILAYRFNPQAPIELENAEKRRVFEENLIKQDLELEHVRRGKEPICAVKIHAPLEVLRRYAEILKFRMPMKELQGLPFRKRKSVFSPIKRAYTVFSRKIFVDDQHFPKVPHRFTAIYSRDKEYLFDIHRENFFTPAIRSRIVQFILDRNRYPTNIEGEMSVGIERLVTENVYCSAYPLHDGDINEKGTMREQLYTNWTSISNWNRYQPLDYIKEYFGVKIGLYFAWLEFYTHMLLMAAIVGVLCLFYSLFTLEDFVPAKDICDNGTTIMCPLCDWCEFWDLHETCYYAKITYLIDNESTVFFAVFMSFWATLFLKLWKRYSAEITHRWDLTGFDIHEEHPRPEYLESLKNIPPTRIDYVTNTKEPTAPFWRMKFPATVFSFSAVLMLIALAFAALVGVIVYRMSMVAVFKLGKRPMTTSTAIIVASVLAAFVNLVFLYILNYMYYYLALYLTELEMWRTQTEFDDSLTLKIYLLQFVNYYSSIFYIAFFKGKFVGHPGQYIKVFQYRQEECSSDNCLTELCIQLAIIMIGKQIICTILELILPVVWRKIYSPLTKKEHEQHLNGERWIHDLTLLDWGSRYLFAEYLEMVLQYGFVTLFVAAFPLAPLFALLNNILEMRLDGKKLLIHHKRPVSQRVRDIGVWYRILDFIGKLSVITNGFIIAFTSDMIPRWVYRALVSPDGSLNGYLDFSLSIFKVSDSPALQSLAGDNPSLITCMYSDYREPPTSPQKYDLTRMYYIILASRLGFVVIFENFVALVMILVRWGIPRMSTKLRYKIRRENYITNEIIIEQESLKTKFARESSSPPLQHNVSTNDNDYKRYYL